MTGPEALAEGFAAQVRRWSLGQGASAAVATAAAMAARQLSLATAAGQVCLGLDELDGGGSGPIDTTAWREALLASGVTGTPSARGALPLIVDEGDRLYLHRYFDLEQRLADRLRIAAAPVAEPVSTAALETLRALFPPRAEGEVDWQQVAAALALRQRLVVISGGPGTGKTTTVVQLLACLLAQQPDCRIALAAPTGKAAARMTEALRERAAHLPEALRDRLPSEPYTVHRLLGGTPGHFQHHAGRRLPLDLLVVDEASMLDLALATRLFEALPDTARLLLLGDKDQLAAVEAGAVFAELSADPSLSPRCIDDVAAACGIEGSRLRPPAPLHAGALPDSTVWLQRNHRFAATSAIGLMAAATQRGDAASLLQVLGEPRSDVAWLASDDPLPDDALWRAMQAGFAPYLAALRHDPADHAAALAEFARFRVLCALREGPRGVQACNERMLELLPPAAARTAARPGQPVMVLRNEAMLGLFNGDIGLLLPDASGALAAVFPDPQGGTPRRLPLARLPAHETAFAMTVHKAQGSEFDEVLLMLPNRPSRVLGRELLYTALTRARQRVTVAAPAAVLAEATATPTRRRSGLQARLAEAPPPRR